MCLFFPPQLQPCNQSCPSRWYINYKKETSSNFSPSKGANWYVSDHPEPHARRSKVSHGCCWGSGPRNWIFCLLKIVKESSGGHASQKIYIVHLIRLETAKSALWWRRWRCRTACPAGWILSNIFLLLSDGMNNIPSNYITNSYLRRNLLYRWQLGNQQRYSNLRGFFFTKFIQVTGVVKAVHVKEGDTVDEDQILVEIE